MSNEKTPLKKDTTKVDNLYVIDAINGQWEQVDSFKDAWDYIKETAMEGSEIHPDAESIFVVQQVAFLHVEETTERMEIDGDEMPVCKVDLIRNEYHKESPTPLSADEVLNENNITGNFRFHNLELVEIGRWEILCAMEEYASQQTAKLRQQMEDLKVELKNSEGAHDITLDTLSKERSEYAALKERNEKMEALLELFNSQTDFDNFIERVTSQLHYLTFEGSRKIHVAENKLPIKGEAPVVFRFEPFKILGKETYYYSPNKAGIINHG